MAKSYGKIYKNKSNVSITPFDIYNLYPIGSIYITLNNDNPSIYFGGEWEQIKGRFLLGTGAPDGNTDNFFGAMSGTTYNAGLGTLGGQDYHTLTTEEMPSHNHGYETYIDKNPLGGIDKVITYGNPAGTTYYTFETLYKGANAKHNNMPPYLAVNIWKRIA